MSLDPELTALAVVLALGAVVAWLFARRTSAVRRSEQRYALAMEAAGDGHTDWDLQTGEHYISPRLLQICNHPPGMTFHDRADWVRNFPFHPEDRPKWEQAVAAHFAGRESNFKMELRIVVRGEVRWTAFHFLSTRDAAGRPIRWTGSIGDITEQKLAEVALRESEERYELAMAASESGYWDWHIPSGLYFSSARASEMVGFPPENTYTQRGEFTGRIPVHPEDWARWDAAREELFAGTGERLAMEVRYIVDGETRWHSFQAICKRDESGNVMRWTGSTTDITERKLAEEDLRKMEQELRQAQRLETVGTLAGGIAHDFNNILGAILGYGEMAMRDAKRGTRLRRDLESILAAGDRGRSLVDRVLAFSRSSVGERVPVHVQEVTREALDQVAASLPKNVSISTRLRAGRAAILGDSTQVHQVVMNLASNAVHAMPNGGVLRVEVEAVHIDAARPATVGSIAPGDYVVLKVSDTGGGIPTQVFERMFDPFFTTREVGVGSGLGLSLVHGIVTNVGGAIDVVTALGKGTTFTVYLQRSGDAEEKQADDNRPLPRGEGQRVLVVDDEEPLVRLATETLEYLGYVPVGFTSSAAALAAFRADPGQFDVVLTDERMPGISGSALIREMRGIRDAIPVVLMSGYLGIESVDADVVVRKPVSTRDLAASMARALEP